MGLEISKLIEVAESVVYDDQIGLAEQISKPVQIIIDEMGRKHELRIVLTMLKDL